MTRYQQIMKQGARVYENYARRNGFIHCNRKFADFSSPLSPPYILLEDRFTTGHDDSALFVELINTREEILVSWKFEGPEPKRFENPDFYDYDCLVYYLKETLNLEVRQQAWGY